MGRKIVKMFAFGLVLVLLLSGMLVGVSATVQAKSDQELVAEWHFDEGSGSVVKDSSGNGNDGTIHGAKWVDGKYGKALSFDGNGDYVEITPRSDVSASRICVGEQFKTFSEKGISFDYPGEWFRVGFTWEPEPEWGVCLSAGTGNEPGVFVLRFLLDDKTLEEFATESRESGYGTGFTTTSLSKTTINGLLAYTYHYAGTKYGESVEGDTMIITADGVKVYWVDCFATKAEYSENKANFQRVFESFRIGDGTPAAPSVFDTEPSENPYPNIMGTHTGTIKPSCNINVSKMYTYSCAGTGGHTESIKLYENDTLIASGTWDGYQDDYHNITIHNVSGAPYVMLYKGHEYNYTIVTGSYPQIIHEPSKKVIGGIITCSSFVDANGKRYNNWIPAIRFE